MDKRTLFFVFSLTLAFFGVNLYFENKNKDTLTQLHLEEKSKKEKELNELAAELSEKTASLNTLHVVSLNLPTSTPVFGAKVGETMVVFSWDENLPSEIEVDNTSYYLSFDPHKKGDLALFGIQKGSPLKFFNPSSFQDYDVQVVSLTEQPSVTLGNLLNGYFFLQEEEIATLKKQLGKESASFTPPTQALLFIKFEDTYLPFAILKEGGPLFLEEIAPLSPFLKKEMAVAPQNKDKKEMFFVIQNEYQQIVFSNKGGAVVEINLPFESKSDKASVVLPIQFDREMVKNHPHNALFPENAYFVFESGEKVFKEEGTLGGYYPLLRRNLVRGSGLETLRPLARNYAFNILSDYPESAEALYEVKEFTSEKIVFEARFPTRKIRKTYSLSKEKNAPYTFDLHVDVEGKGNNLWISTGIPDVEWISNAPAPALKYRVTKKGSPEIVSLDLPTEPVTALSVQPDWLCNSNGFFGVILDPVTPIDPGYKALFIPGEETPSRLLELEGAYGKFKAKELPGYSLLLPLKAKGGSIHFRVFAGPFSDKILKKVDAFYSDKATGYNPDYTSCQSFHGWFSFISQPFAKLLFILINFFHFITGSWALSIVLLTVALRIMLYPLNAWSLKSVLKMKKIAPLSAKIQEKYKKDPQRMQMEILGLYKEHKVNPLSGILLMFIQMPFLIGMFDLLKSTFELRGASFIPGWIDNLSAPDVVFSWTTPFWIIGNEFHFLPILLGLIMFLQQKMMVEDATNANAMSDQQRQQQAVGAIMPIIFTIMFWNAPSGLNIYWLSSMLLGMLQQWSMTKKLKLAV